MLTAAAALGALTAGLSGSLHCALMCGPLACAGGGSSRAAALSWHFGRVVSYSLLGVALGAFGLGVLHFALPRAESVLPWVMAFGLVLTALDVGRWLRVPGGARLAGFAFTRSARFAPAVRAGAIGAVTPLLPCGLVYGMALSALASGSAFRGGLVMFSFALGAVPALVLAQVQLRWLQRARPRAFEVARRVVPLAAAVIIVWRALAAGPGDTTCH